jgi:hypothetical protein
MIDATAQQHTAVRKNSFMLARAGVGFVGKERRAQRHSRAPARRCNVSSYKKGDDHGNRNRSCSVAEAVTRARRNYADELLDAEAPKAGERRGTTRRRDAQAQSRGRLLGGSNLERHEPGFSLGLPLGRPRKTSRAAVRKKSSSGRVARGAVPLLGAPLRLRAVASLR